MSVVVTVVYLLPHMVVRTLKYVVSDLIFVIKTVSISMSGVNSTVRKRKAVLFALCAAAEPGLIDTNALTKEARWSMEITKGIAGMEFGDALEYVMSARRITIEQLEETSLISARTIRRLRKVEDGNVKKEHILALAICIHLPPLVSMELINIAGLRLTHSFKDSIYATILYSMYQLDIFTVNSYL